MPELIGQRVGSRHLFTLLSAVRPSPCNGPTHQPLPLGREPRMDTDGHGLFSTHFIRVHPWLIPGLL